MGNPWPQSRENNRLQSFKKFQGVESTVKISDSMPWRAWWDVNSNNHLQRLKADKGDLEIHENAGWRRNPAPRKQSNNDVLRFPVSRLLSNLPPSILVIFFFSPSLPPLLSIISQTNSFSIFPTFSFSLISKHGCLSHPDFCPHCPPRRSFGYSQGCRCRGLDFCPRQGYSA